MDRIGYYKHPVCGCENGFGDIMYGYTPYFQIREIPSYVDLDSQNHVQVLIQGVGGLTWINVDKQDLVDTVVVEFRGH